MSFYYLIFFFFKQKTAYEIGLGIPAEPLFRSIQGSNVPNPDEAVHSTRNKTRDGLIRVRNIRALNGRFNTSITHAYSIVIGSKHITLNRSEERRVGKECRCRWEAKHFKKKKKKT